MEFMDVVLARRSVRRLLADPVTREDLEKTVAAGDYPRIESMASRVSMI